MIYFPRKPHAVIFDMDGLIFDTEALYRDASMIAAFEQGLEMPPALYLGTIGLSSEGARALLGSHFGQNFNLESFWAAASDHFWLMAENQLRLKPGVIELLDMLEGSDLPRAIATSSPHKHVQHHLALHGLIERFDVIVACDDYACGKPDPEPYLTAAKRLGVAPERCVALEDSPNGIRAASGAGMMAIMVPDLIEPTDEIRPLCLHIAADLHEVREIISATG